MPNYFVNQNPQPDGYHEVHVDDNSCPHPPLHVNRVPLGWHSNCQSAVAAAKQRYILSDGCAYCVPNCHTR
jgi:hypothetical protein